MRVALVIMNAEGGRGGAEKFTLDLARSLCDRGHEVSLLATRFDRDVEPARQVRLEGAAGGRIARYRTFLDSLDEHLNTTSYDIVHAMLPVRKCDLYHPHAGIEAYNLERGHLRHNGVIRRTISRFSNQLNRKRRLYAQVERELLEGRRAMVLCLSGAMQQVAAEHYDLRDGQSHVLINGVDLNRYYPDQWQGERDNARTQYAIASGEIVALLMSNNFRLKGLRQAILSLQQLVQKGHTRAKLMVAGREPVESYRRLAEQLGIANHVIFTGPTKQPQSLYAASDLFVLPTAYDSCSLVVLEALAMGKPVITTRRNGAAEVMEDGIQGFVTEDQADLAGLTEAWEDLLNDGLRTKMAQEAVNLRPSLSSERYLDGLLEVYGSIKSAGGAKPG